jgi:hypothetical protein
MKLLAACLTAKIELPDLNWRKFHRSGEFYVMGQPEKCVAKGKPKAGINGAAAIYFVGWLVTPDNCLYRGLSGVILGAYVFASFDRSETKIRPESRESEFKSRENGRQGQGSPASGGSQWPISSSA